MQLHTNRFATQAYVPPADQALYVQGLSALRGGDLEEAIRLLTCALRRQPGHLGMRRNLVRALLRAERFEQVLIQANAALDIKPEDAELHFARGMALNALGQPSKASGAFAKALSLQPDHAESWLNMGNASAGLDNIEAAETMYRAALRLDPALAEAHASLGFILTRQGRLPEAIAACEAAIALRPGFAQAHWNLATGCLLAGDLPRGFAEAEWRKHHPRFRGDFPALPGPEWDGSPGKTVLIRAEQGAGDTIQFARYLPSISERGCQPSIACAPALVPLLSSLPGVAAIAATDPSPSFDAWIDQMSLPRLFGTAIDNIPSPGQYLSADPTRVAAWQQRLAPGFRVGLALAGNPKHTGDKRRSVPFALADRLTGLPGFVFVNLQHGPMAADIGLPDLTGWLQDYTDTAALIQTLDLVVTVDTSVAHLAGSLGKRVWIMLPHAPDWRWMLGRTDSPWYRSARLFRQPSPGAWTAVLEDIGEQLLAARATFRGA